MIFHTQPECCSQQQSHIYPEMAGSSACCISVNDFTLADHDFEYHEFFYQMLLVSQRADEADTMDC